ncbi:13063_t:CDS:2 [Ambispora gerdemannii]|uniref:13063_t:CDS:1 n=1 Tax=Ambispora gerdemannii TaxID=144530 RepID=A0A9N8UYN6_9GLOM|nr:13063_t:CDS:2 [Ambispora gerdemannii]
MDNTNNQKIEGNNYMRGNQINGELRKKVLNILRATLTKSNPIAEQCFTRAKSIEDDLYKTANNETEYRNLLSRKLAELDPHNYRNMAQQQIAEQRRSQGQQQLLLPQQQNPSQIMLQQQLTQRQQMQTERIAAQQQQQQIQQIFQNLQQFNPPPQPLTIQQLNQQQQQQQILQRQRFPQRPTQQSLQLTRQQHQQYNQPQLAQLTPQQFQMLQNQYQLQLALQLEYQQQVAAQLQQQAPLTSFMTASPQMSPHQQHPQPICSLKNQQQYMNPPLNFLPQVNTSSVNLGGIHNVAATSTSNLININQAPFQINPLQPNAYTTRPAVINPLLRSSIEQLQGGYQLPTMAITSSTTEGLFNVNQLSPTSLTPNVFSPINMPFTNSFTNISSVPAATPPYINNIQQPTPPPRSNMSASSNGQLKVLSGLELSEATSAIRKIDQERKKLTSYPEPMGLSDQDKRAISETIKSLVPMSKKLDEYLPYLWHIYKSKNSITRILNLKQMVQDSQQALSIGKFYMDLASVEKLYIEFKTILEASEKSRRGEIISNPFPTPLPAPRHANKISTAITNIPNLNVTNQKLVTDVMTNQNTGMNTNQMGNAPNKNLQTTTNTRGRGNAYEKVASVVPVLQSMHDAESLGVDITGGNNPKRRRLDVEKLVQPIQENLNAITTHVTPLDITHSPVPVGFTAQAMSTSIFSQAMASLPVDDNGDYTDVEDEKYPPIESLFDRQVTREKQRQSFQRLQEALLNSETEKDVTKTKSDNEISIDPKSLTINPARCLLDGPDPIPESAENKLLVSSLRGAC